MHLTTDILTGNVSYLCACGRTARVHASELRPGSVDYCGCSQLRINLTLEQVNDHRARARVAKLLPD